MKVFAIKYQDEFLRVKFSEGDAWGTPASSFIETDSLPTLFSTFEEAEAVRVEDPYWGKESKVIGLEIAEISIEPRLVIENALK